jgi:hypothetical protein
MNRYQIKTFSRLPEALVIILNYFVLHYIRLSSLLQGFVIASLAFAAGNDILITAILCIYLQKTTSHFKE